MTRLRVDGKVQRFDTTDYFSVVESANHIPELRLLVAVLHKAVHDYASPQSTECRRWAAAKWLFDPSHRIMSVWWICQMLSDDPDGLRERILTNVKELRGKPKLVMFRVDTR